MGLTVPHHHEPTTEFLDLNLIAVEHTWDFLCVCPACFVSAVQAQVSH